MKTAILVAINLGLIGLSIYLIRKKNLLSYFENGKWWLTWLSIAIITLMDELTSVFYVPAESYLEVGIAAFVFIIATSVLMRFLSNRMVEIAQILEFHNIRGGGVYSFSYLVLGPAVSFIAVASILVDYILTAAISTVAAVTNGAAFLNISWLAAQAIMLLIVWGVAGLNVIGIKENARFTFLIFLVAAILLITLLVSGILSPSDGQLGRINEGFQVTYRGLVDDGFFGGIGFAIFGIASVILAYSGIESVIQTAGLVKNWKEIKRGYTFLAVTVGIFTPLLTMLVLTRTDLDFLKYKNELITQYASMLNGPWFGLAIGALASFTLIMAVNTAFVASSELIERVAHRYSFDWIIKTNRRDSLYRIHVMNATLFSVIILATAGSQTMLAHMYAVGLVASFTINMGALVYYRYSRGKSEVTEYSTSRTGTAIIFAILLSCFIFIAYHKVAGLALWAVAVVIALVVGFRVAKRRAPEIEHLQKSDNPMSLIFQVAETEQATFHIFFRRPKDASEILTTPDNAYVTFFTPRAGSPEKLSINHYRFPIKAESLYSRIVDFIELLQYDFPGKNIVFHVGWPTSSWLDRMSVGVMVFSMMRLPKRFPKYEFVMEYRPGA